MKHSSSKRIIAILCILYIVIMFVLGEGILRVFWAVKKDVPSFNKVYYAFYPEIKEVEHKAITREDGYFDILMLGGSVLNKKYGSIENILLKKLVYRTNKKIRIHNLSKPAHSSLDSYYKYRHLSDKEFDLIILYHGINEVRANNCPSPLFKSDYSHYSWYEMVNMVEKKRRTGFVAFPFTIDYYLIKIKEWRGLTKYVPKNRPRKKWIKYGSNIKTARPFRGNLIKILDIAKNKDEKVLLMTFSFYVPEGYTYEKFKNKLLDYRRHWSPIEIWGSPENVILGITTHNAIIENISKKYDNVFFINQEKLVPKKGENFEDIAHFTFEGSKKFVENIIKVIEMLVLKNNQSYN